jgi:hypothetical protein
MAILKASTGIGQIAILNSQMAIFESFNWN